MALPSIQRRVTNVALPAAKQAAEWRTRPTKSGRSANVSYRGTRLRSWQSRERLGLLWGVSSNAVEINRKSMDTSSSFQRVARDILDLCELQMQLVSVDSQAAKRKLVTAVICSAAAMTLAGSALTVLIVGGGLLLVESTSLSAGGGLLVIAVATLLCVAALLCISLSAVKAAAAAMAETKSEFAENIRWLKATLVKPSKSPRNQIRRESFPEAAYPESAPGRESRGGEFRSRSQNPQPLQPR